MVASGAIRALIFAACLASTLGANDVSQSAMVRKKGISKLAEGAAVPAEELQNVASLVRTRKGSNALMEGGAALPTDELKTMLSSVLQNPQMKAMAKDPNMVRGLVQLMHDPEQMEHFTGDADLAQSLSSLVQKEPHVVMEVLKDSGFEVGMSKEDAASASTEEIHAEFVRLSHSDNGIMARLKKNNGLRQHLKEKLGGVMDNALAENKRVNERLDNIHDAAKSNRRVVVQEDGSLIEAKKDMFKDFEEMMTVEEIESALDEMSKQINKKIKVLQAQDEVELKALEDNAQLRAALKGELLARVKEQEKELSFASDVETQTFDKI